MTLLGYVGRGGAISWILLTLLVLVLTLAIERCIYFLLSRTPRQGSPIQQLRAKSVELTEESVSERNRILMAKGAQFRKEMDQGLWIFNFVTAAAPSLGLLGTVVGLISAFQGMAAAGATGSIQDFSGGIWVAMLTTAFGLVVAIPSLFCSHFFHRIVSLRIMEIGMAIEAFSENCGLETVPPKAADYA